MDLQQYLTILWRRKWIIVITVLMTEIVVVIVFLKMTPIYSATTTIRISSTTVGSLSYQDYVNADRKMNTYIKLATTSPVLDELKQRLGLSEVPSIQVLTIPNTELFKITFQHRDPNMAALGANTLADILISQSLDLYTGSGESSLDILGQQVSSMEQEVNQASKDYMDLVTNKPKATEEMNIAREMLDLKQQMYSTILDQYEQARLRESLRSKSIFVVEPAIPPNKPAKTRKELIIP